MQFKLCSTTRQMRENKVLDVNEALTFTVIDSRNTKVSKHNRQIGGGATPTEGVFWHTQLTCTRSFARLKCLNYVAFVRPQFWVMLEQ